MLRAICPVCWNRETMRARQNGGEPCRDEPDMMCWRKPHGGPKGQQVTRWDDGHWVCESCGFYATAHDVGTLLDAALMASDPHCDSIVNGIHGDALVAFHGGPTGHGPWHPTSRRTRL